jgi:hypothetical protein
VTIKAEIYLFAYKMETGRTGRSSYYGGVTGRTEQEDDFTPLLQMPSSRLHDIYNDLLSKPATVVNLDACIPELNGYSVLRTILEALPPSVKTLSLRFNNLTNPVLSDFLISWIAENDTLEILYMMGTGFEEKRRVLIEAAWKKHLKGHRTDNLGFTFIRNALDAQAKPTE